MEGKQRILVVDDENDICEVIKLNLELNGYAVDTASTAEEALKKDLSQFSLLLLDVMMGEMSGYELTQKNKRRQQISLIAHNTLYRKRSGE